MFTVICHGIAITLCLKGFYNYTKPKFSYKKLIDESSKDIKKGRYIHHLIFSNNDCVHEYNFYEYNQIDTSGKDNKQVSSFIMHNVTNINFDSIKSNNIISNKEYCQNQTIIKNTLKNHDISVVMYQRIFTDSLFIYGNCTSKIFVAEFISESLDELAIYLVENKFKKTWFKWLLGSVCIELLGLMSYVLIREI